MSDPLTDLHALVMVDPTDLHELVVRGDLVQIKKGVENRTFTNPSTILSYALVCGNLEIFLFALGLETNPRLLVFPLIWTIYYGRLEMLEPLLLRGASPTLTPIGGSTTAIAASITFLQGRGDKYFQTLIRYSYSKDLLRAVSGLAEEKRIWLLVVVLSFTGVKTIGRIGKGSRVRLLSVDLIRHLRDMLL